MINMNDTLANQVRIKYPQKTEFSPKEPNKLSSTSEEPVLTHEQIAYPTIPAE